MNWEIRFDSNTLCVCQPLGRLRLCDPMNCSSPPGPSVHGALQAGTLDWAASLFSRGSFQPRDRTRVSCAAGRSFTVRATREAAA